MAGTRATSRGRGASKRGKGPARAQGGQLQHAALEDPDVPASEDIDSERASSVAAEELVATALRKRTPRPSQKQAAINNDKQTSVAKELEDLKKKYMKLKQQSKLDRNDATGVNNEGGALSDAPFESEEEDDNIVQQRQHQSEFSSRGIVHTGGAAERTAKRLRLDGASARVSTGDNALGRASGQSAETLTTATPSEPNTSGTTARVRVDSATEPAMPASGPGLPAVVTSSTQLAVSGAGSNLRDDNSVVSRTPHRHASPNGCWPTPSTCERSPEPSHDELDVPSTALSTHQLSGGQSAQAARGHDLALVPSVTLQSELQTLPPAINAPYKHGQAPTGKPKASDYDPRVDKLIINACHQYEVLISTEEPFPEAGTPVMWASRVWSDICKSAEVNYTLSDRIEKIITGRASHGRGGLRDKIRPLISGTYGFLLDGSERSKVANLARYNFLLDRDALEPEPRFHYEDVEVRRRFAHNRIVTTVIKEQWFADAGGPGVKYATQFSPIREVTLALIFTTIEYCLDQWVSGHYDKNLTFSEKVYRAKYERHLLHIREWCKLDSAATRSIRQRMYDRARFVIAHRIRSYRV
ncbi:hypothetical protein TRAPUB_3960 [Trametes pubescens]|uniref:DUF6532 domain-containing protein n=1 Tax=Trametes pubescens TaxID=154538 RepID=A0A1M2VCJ1_TRAPU|nr:hypothetical protein TRAPUB_3960 [Trametes pubescens]